MEEMATNYKGSHLVKLNRNRQNLGISSHVRVIHETSNGKYVVHAAGDDVSLPERVHLHVAAYQAQNEKVLFVVSNAEKISKSGKHLGLLTQDGKQTVVDKPSSPLQRNLPALNGCTASVHRNLIHAFPPPHPSIIAEDVLLLRRAYLIGHAKYIPEPLVKYRIDTGISSDAYKISLKVNQYLRQNKDQLERIHQFFADADHIGHKPTQETKKISSNLISRVLLEQAALLNGEWVSLLAAIRKSTFRHSIFLLKAFIFLRLKNANENRNRN